MIFSKAPNEGAGIANIKKLSGARRILVANIILINIYTRKSSTCDANEKGVSKAYASRTKA